MKPSRATSIDPMPSAPPTLIGTYTPPTVKKGERVACLYRDAECVVTGWHTGRITSRFRMAGWPGCKGLRNWPVAPMSMSYSPTSRPFGDRWPNDTQNTASRVGAAYFIDEAMLALNSVVGRLPVRKAEELATALKNYLAL